MTLNELIARLEEIRDERGGELPVFVFDADWAELDLEPEQVDIEYIERVLIEK